MITICIPGIPKPGGSKKSFPHSKTGKIVTIDACKMNKDWRNTVSIYAKQAYKEKPLSGPLKLKIVFLMPRPKNHYKKVKGFGTKLKDDAPLYHTIRPDITKLIRSLEDALTGIIWNDDAQIVNQSSTKIYSNVPGVMVYVSIVKEEIHE